MSSAIRGNLSIGSVSCVSVSFCAAVANPSLQAGESGSSTNLGYALTYDGSSWSQPLLIDRRSGISSVSCASAKFCVAVDQWADVMTYNGSSWTPPQSLGPDLDLYAVSCDSAGRCVAVGQLPNNVNSVDGFIFDGVKWEGPIPVATGMIPFSVSCTSATFCVVVGEGDAGERSPGRALVNDGSGWGQPATLSSRFVLGQVSCASTTCVALAGAGGLSSGPIKDADPGDVLVYRGGAWQAPEVLDTDPITAVGCASPTYCVAGNIMGDLFTFDGSSWSAALKIPGATSFIGIACTPSSFCMAVDADGHAFASGPADPSSKT